MSAQPELDRGKQLEALNEVARIATMDLELRPMLQRITEALGQKFGWEFVSCVSVDATHGRFVCEAVCTTMPTAVHVGYSRELGSGVVGEVAETGRAILLDDVRTSGNYFETMPGALSELCVPVTHRGQLVAVLNLESTRPAAFHDQLPLLETIADQVAGAIFSARLYEDLRRVNAELAAANRRLEELSLQDGLTGIANRRCFEAVFDVEWRRARRSAAPLAVLLADIDEFKRFNDHYGHQRGDECLRAVAGALAAALHRASDTVARYGGEEFVVVLPDSDAEHAMATAEKLRSRVRQLDMPHAASPVAPVVTISIGGAVAQPVPEDSPHTLLGAADAALYRAKAAGRDCACFRGYPPGT